MRVVANECMSLDGVVQAPGGPDEDTEGDFSHGGWSMPYFDPEGDGRSHCRRDSTASPKSLYAEAAAIIAAMATSRFSPLLVAAALILGCAEQPAPEQSEPASADQPEAPAPESSPQDAYWAALQDLCGQAFAGRVVESVPPDPSFDDQTLVMHVRECGPEEIRIPFFVGEDRSRTWVLTRTGDGLRLKHDHRHEDGTEDDVTQYGGDTRDAGGQSAQAFYADDFTAELVPTAATNVWSIEVDPASGLFAYALRREVGERRFRAEFDLGAPIDEPAPPWGWERR